MNVFTVLILVCAVGVPRVGCNEQTALDVIRGPDEQNEMMCGFHAQALFAETAMSAGMTDRKYLKILCSRKRSGEAG